MRFFLTLIIFLIIGVLVGFFSALIQNKGHKNYEEFIQRYLQSIEETFELQTLEVTGVAELYYEEKDAHFLSYFTNPLFSKQYHFYVPFQAIYGIPLKNTRFLKFFDFKIYVDIPKAELVSFDLKLSDKKIISKEGWWVFQDDKKFLEFEKKIYEKQKNELKNHQEFKERARKEAQNKMLELLAPLNLPVEFSFISNY
ncbi:MAG: hypothetical protein KatS3mg035_0173 [Bacteroidia bacterium]|nr:MAG: hypothetical protein KatS3mg035_0173 [Bacteroidia bacterium]